MTEPNTNTPPALAFGGAQAITEFRATVQKAERGDKSALAAVREWLARPGAADVLCGNLAREAMERLVAAWSGNSPVTREATLRKLDELRAELSGPNPSALEKLLVERVVATWLHLYHLEGGYASKESMSLSVGLYYQKCLTAAQKRYLAALKGLAEVRRLALPVLQVNIAKKQVNMVGTTPALSVPTAG
ncbi:MAG: hypothetical protein K2V38_10295 [Gemmataceae bacterium]|nr:hypothetical protein [Gemmataceae bacterium]